ncbi:hypothetical protein SISNIDRAFT_125214 [Sistotremastrum niveocremeum HHB9708]|uniref:Uncharacterized protein n=1 Tax=Sistotremastrum niveocremeum HHB9708 TaxID=1314777 RepID=A0A164TAN0_9AGAM|nr:hypothetical protein SISNIDRAFT_125214 [Sistotremastrum niveocremeum HHB9708]
MMNTREIVFLEDLSQLGSFQNRANFRNEPGTEICSFHTEWSSGNCLLIRPIHPFRPQNSGSVFTPRVRQPRLGLVLHSLSTLRHRSNARILLLLGTPGIVLFGYRIFSCLIYR